MLTREVKLEEILNGLIERGGYSRNRQAILESVGISAAALSQYARGHTRPSFQKLVALADFFGVSLDYLVFGKPSPDPVDPTPLAKYVEHAIADALASGSRHTDLMTRIGRVLTDRIDEVARELAASPTTAGEGLIELDEVLRVERYCRQADIVATDLGANVIDMAGDPAAGQFLQVVTSNLARGCRYRFLLSGELRTDSVARFREMVAAPIGDDHLNEHCSFRRTIVPIMGGSGLYRLDVGAFAAEEPGLFTQFKKYLFNGSWFGYLNRPNDESNADMLMTSDYTARACGAFEALWNAASHHV